jgi:site-specific recombinase XerD
MRNLRNYRDTLQYQEGEDIKALIPAPAKAEVMATAPALEELVSRFIEAQDLAPSSKDTYSRQLKRFISWLQDTGKASSMGQLSREDILAYKQSLQDSGLSAYSVSGYLVTVRKLFTWLES